MNRFTNGCRMLVFGCLVMSGLLHGMKRKSHDENVRIIQDKTLASPGRKIVKTGEVEQVGMLTPIKKERRAGIPPISPQKVQFSAINTARAILKSLEDGDPRKASQSLSDSLASFPGFFSKIKWFIAADGLEGAKTSFKRALSAALDFCLLTCLANSSHQGDRLIMPEFKLEQEGSSVHLGHYNIFTRLQEKDWQHGVISEKGEEKVLPYNPDNRIKKAFVGAIFGKEKIELLQEVLQEILRGLPTSLHVSKEQFYHALVYGMIRFMGSIYPMYEIYTGEGRADLILMSEFGRSIIEFKYNRTAQEALDQIQKQNYQQCFEQEGVVHAIGINISNEEQPLTVTCLSKLLKRKQTKIKGNGECRYISLPL